MQKYVALSIKDILPTIHMLQSLLAQGRCFVIIGLFIFYGEYFLGYL